MIVQLTGILQYKNIDELIIDINGVGYLCYISNNTFNKLPNLGQQFTLLTFLHIMENKHTLYGFIAKEERELFTLLISVSGIGPKIGIQLLSKTDTQKMSNMIISSDVKMLSSLPGIGPKTAKRLIVELKDKFTFTIDNDLPLDSTFSTDHKDAYNALLTLGYKSSDIDKVMQTILGDKPDMSTEELIKNCLKMFK